MNDSPTKPETANLKKTLRLALFALVAIAYLAVFASIMYPSAFKASIKTIPPMAMLACGILLLVSTLGFALYWMNKVGRKLKVSRKDYHYLGTMVFFLLLFILGGNTYLLVQNMPRSICATLNALLLFLLIANFDIPFTTAIVNLLGKRKK